MHGCLLVLLFGEGVYIVLLEGVAFSILVGGCLFHAWRAVLLSLKRMVLYLHMVLLVSLVDSTGFSLLLIIYRCHLFQKHSWAPE